MPKGTIVDSLGWVALAAALASLPASARAGDDADLAAARAAYEDGKRAYKSGEPARAAEYFARADQLAPNPAALEAGLRAALKADEPVIGMELVRRAKGRPVEGSLASTLEEARGAFQNRVGKIVVVCAACKSIKLDGSDLEHARPRWALTGPHLVDLDWGGESERRLVTVAAGKTARFTPARGEQNDAASSTDGAPADPPPDGASAAAKPPPPAPAPQATPPSIRGLSPAWFWAGAGVTAALGVATAASALDTAERHNAYMTAPSLQGAADGKAAQTRTHVLLGFTSAAAVSTAVIGIVAVRWKEPAVPASKLTGSIAPAPGGLAASLHGRF